MAVANVRRHRTANPGPREHVRRMLEPHQFQRCHGVLSERLWKHETVSIANMMPR